ncbi:MAG TPA: hypothetical protein VF772_17870, partial [Terriglobales bacterium]
MSERLQRRLILLKPGHGGGLIFGQIALWIDRWLPAFRRGERQLNTCISEHEVGSHTLERGKDQKIRASLRPLIMYVNGTK